jgi:hypothetical protein
LDDSSVSGSLVYQLATLISLYPVGTSCPFFPCLLSGSCYIICSVIPRLKNSQFTTVCVIARDLVPPIRLSVGVASEPSEGHAIIRAVSEFVCSIIRRCFNEAQNHQCKVCLPFYENQNTIYTVPTSQHYVTYSRRRLLRVRQSLALRSLFVFSTNFSLVTNSSATNLRSTSRMKGNLSPRSWYALSFYRSSLKFIVKLGSCTRSMYPYLCYGSCSRPRLPTVVGYAHPPGAYYYSSWHSSS